MILKKNDDFLEVNFYTSSESPGIHTSINGDLSLQGVTIRGTFVF